VFIDIITYSRVITPVIIMHNFTIMHSRQQQYLHQQQVSLTMYNWQLASQLRNSMNKFDIL